MLRKGLLASLVSIGLIASPAAAAATQVDRLPSSVGQGEQIAGNPWIPWLFGLAALIAIVWVVVDDDEDAVSP